jgi:hypothetical protein
MTRLPVPVKDALRDPTTPKSVERMWARIEVRSRPSAPRRVTTLPAWALVAAIALVVSGAVAAVWRLGQPRDAHRLGAPSTSGMGASANEPIHPAAMAPSAASAPSVAATVSAGAASATARGVEDAPPHATAPATGSPVGWRQLARKGENAQAFSALGRDGIVAASSTASVEDLLALADVARLSGHPRDARVPLGQIIERYPGDPRAPLAALTLGRVELKSLGMPAEAAASLDKAIAFGLPAGVSDDAYSLLVEARLALGDKASARRAYDGYLARFPHGERAEELRARVEAP